MNFKEEFKKIIDENSIVLFLKGTKDMPVCGFSKTTVNLLNHYGVDFKDVKLLRFFIGPNRLNKSKINLIKSSELID